MTVKTDRAGFVKQEDGLILNNNLHELEHYRKKVKEIQNAKKDERHMKHMENRIASLENKLDLILEKLSRDS